MSLGKLCVAGVVMELCYVSLFVFESPQLNILLYIVVHGAAFAMLAYLQFVAMKQKEPITTGILAVIIGFAFVFRLTLVLHEPVASDDIYRYVWDGKVAAYGINPYAYSPASPEISSLSTHELPAKINFPEMRTIYPPLAQVFFFFSNLVFGDSVRGMKLLLVLLDMATIGLLIFLVRESGMKTSNVLLYAWSPLPIMYFGLDGHIDALGIPFLILFLLLIARGRPIAAALALGGSALAKVHPLFIAPLLMKHIRGRSRFVIPLIPVSLFVVGCWLYYEPTGGLFESFTVFSATWDFNGSIFKLIFMLMQSNEQAHGVSGLMFFVWVMFLLWLERPIMEKVFLGFFGMMLLAPVVHPWYLTWLAALLVVRWALSAFVLLGLSNLSNIVVHQYSLTGTWDENPWILALEYCPVFILLIREVARGDFSVSRSPAFVAT